MQLSFGKKEAAKGKADDKGRKDATASKPARGKGSGRAGSKVAGDAQKGKRKSVEEKAKSTEPKGAFSAPALIMGPRLLFIAAIVILCVLGLVMIYSSSSIEAYGDSAFGNNPMYFFKQQVLWLVIGTVACVAAALIPYHFWKRRYVAYILWGITALLLLAVALGLGSTQLGADRSLSLGPINIQPAEFAKISVILVMASILERWNTGEIDGQHACFELMGIAGFTLFLIFKQPDLGTSMILIIGILAMLVLAGIDKRIVLLLIGFGVVFFIFTSIVQPYHLDRIWTMLDPWADAQGNGYQTVQGFLAFGSGGIFGTGLGLSRQKYDYLPYAYNDFIYAVIGEELGLVGALATLLLFVVFIYAGMRISHTARDTFGGIIAGALTTMVGFQACLNMACVVGVAPVTGKALPFISYGGSSLLATMIMCGLVLSVSRFSRLDNQVEKRRENLIVMDGGRAAARGVAQTPQAGSQGVGGVFGGIAGAVGGVVGGVGSRFSHGGFAPAQGRGTRGAASGQRADAEHQRNARQEGAASRGNGTVGSGRLSSERGRSNSGYGARPQHGSVAGQQHRRGSGSSATGQRNVGYGQPASGDTRAAWTRQQAANIDSGHSSRRNPAPGVNRASYGSAPAQEHRRPQGQQAASSRRPRRGDMDVDLVDIRPRAPRPQRPDDARRQHPDDLRRQQPRPNRSSSASHGGSGRSPRRPKR